MSDAETLLFAPNQLKNEIKTEFVGSAENMDSVFQFKYEDLSLEQYRDIPQSPASIKIEENFEEVENGTNDFVDFDIDDSGTGKYNLAGSDSDLDSRCSETDGDNDMKEISKNESLPFISDAEWQKIVPCQSAFNILSDTSKFNFDSNEIQSPVDVYNLFLTNDILDLIVEETNTYAQELVSKRLPTKSRLHCWTDTNRNEIKNFFSIVLVMGLVELPSVNMYWSKENMFRNDFIANIMSRDRFLLLLRCLHFCNNQAENLVKDNDMYNIENLLRLLNANFKSVLSAGKILVIEDTVIYHAHADFHSSDKLSKHDIKLYKLCTVEGYIIKVIFHVGGNGQPQSHAVVHKLLESLEGKEGRHIFADSYYSSLPLAKTLFEQKIVYCGRLRSNQDVPSSFTKKLRKGETYGEQNDCLKVIKWMDRQPILMLTTDPSHDDNLVTSDDMLKPKCVLDYNKAKKGVVFSDQKLSYHSVLCKGLKWPWKLAFELLFGVAVLNSWIIYNTLFSSSKISIIDFRKMLAKELITNKNINSECKSEGEPGSKRVLHTFIKPSGPGRKRRKICTECYKELRLTHSSRETSNKVSRVTSFCQDCVGQPGFCLPCFNKFHKT